MSYAFVDNYIGYPPIEGPAVAVPASLNLLPTLPGMLVQAVDPVYGSGEFVFARASAGIRQYGLCTLLPVWNSTTKTYTYDAVEVANSANLGQTLAVSQIVLTAGQYGWFQVQGVGPISATASVAAGVTFGITGAGQVGANTAGKQVLNARSVAPSTLAIVKVGRGASGSNQINVADTMGLFLGMALTGTGVGAGVISFIDPAGSYILNTVANSAAVNGNVTATATGFIVASVNRPFAQGAIT
jgi:hypothetical protein